MTTQISLSIPLRGEEEEEEEVGWSLFIYASFLGSFIHSYIYVSFSPRLEWDPLNEVDRMEFHF